MVQQQVIGATREPLAGKMSYEEFLSLTRI